MDRVTRGQMTSHSSAPNFALEPPRVRRAPVVGKPAEANAGTLYTYVNSRSKYLMVKIVARASDPQHVALANAILGYPEHHKGTIDFDGTFHFRTKHPLVAMYLDDAIRRGDLVGVSRATEEIMMRCSLCDYMFPNTKAGLENYAQHQADEHPPVDMPMVPLMVNGYANPGEPRLKPTAEDIRTHEALAADNAARPLENEDDNEFDLTADEMAEALEGAPVDAEPAIEAAPFAFAAEPVAVHNAEESVEAVSDDPVPERRSGNSNQRRSGRGVR